MDFLIIGDSWGKGEWNNNCDDINHTGLEQYLIDDGHTVTNINKGGSSNLDMIFRLHNYLERTESQLPEKILVFQTEWTRDFKYDGMQLDYGSDDWNNLQVPEDLSSKWIERFYFRLSEISQKYKIPIDIIGGCSDTMFFDNMYQDYPGCSIVCQSLTNFIITGDKNIDIPVFSWYTPEAELLIKKLKSFLPESGVHQLLDLMNQGFERECLLRENPQYFYPDGKHPNRHGHYLLFQLLKQQMIV
jgi:hypothetical protein